jgi:hypothetical protein
LGHWKKSRTLNTAKATVMEGLTIRKKVTPQKRATVAASSTDIAIGLLILVALLVVIPFLLGWLLISTLRDKFAAPTPAKPIEPRPIVMHEVLNNLFPLRYHYIMGDAISEGDWDYFDDEPLIFYQPGTSNDFFEGYFSDFKIECPRGIFVQKVNFNSAFTEVETMPLCFFNYVTKESEELLELKDYNLYAKEEPNYFTITATSQEEDEEFATTKFELEISLTDALHSPPDVP